MSRLQDIDAPVYSSELSDWLDIPESTLRWWRHARRGPRSFKVGRRIAYRRADVLAWLDEQHAAEGAA